MAIAVGLTSSTAADRLARAELLGAVRALGWRASSWLLPFVAGVLATFALDAWLRPAPDGPEVRAAREAVVAAQARRAAAIERAEASLRAVDSARAAEDHARRRSIDARQLAIVIDDSTMGVRVTPSAPILSVPIPAAVVSRIVADSLRVLELERGAVKRDTAIADLLAVVARDSAVIDAQANHVRLLERSRAPRCGWKCGAVIGAGTVIIAAIGVKKADDLVGTIVGRVARRWHSLKSSLGR